MQLCSKLCALLTALGIASAQLTLPAPPFSSLSLPEGFQIALYTDYALPSARQMTISEGPEGAPDGNIVYLGSSGGNVSPLLLSCLPLLHLSRTCCVNLHAYRPVLPVQVYAVVDRDGTRTNITTVTLLSGLNTPNGVAYQDGSLWVAQVLNVTRYDNVDAIALAGQVWPLICSSAANQACRSPAGSTARLCKLKQHTAPL